LLRKQVLHLKWMSGLQKAGSIVIVIYDGSLREPHT
jgi:hypothetical protein